MPKFVKQKPFSKILGQEIKQTDCISNWSLCLWGVLTISLESLTYALHILLHWFAGTLWTDLFTDFSKETGLDHVRKWRGKREKVFNSVGSTVTYLR